jgi:hypothetical protein
MPSTGGNTTSPERRAFLMLAAMAPAAVVASQASVGIAAMPAELAASVAAYRRATMRADIAALSALVADDYILVNSDSSLQAKASYLADFALPGFKIERYAGTARVRSVGEYRPGSRPATPGMDAAWKPAHRRAANRACLAQVRTALATRVYPADTGSASIGRLGKKRGSRDGWVSRRKSLERSG